jgi:hypothetical protein
MLTLTLTGSFCVSHLTAIGHMKHPLKDDIDENGNNFNVCVCICKPSILIYKYWQNHLSILISNLLEIIV